MDGDIIKEELKDVLLDCYSSTKVMGTVFFKHHCYRPFGPAHEPIFRLLDDETKRRVLIVCPRGWGKTTIAGLVFPAKKLLFRDVNYIVYISATATKAISDLQTLAVELQTNEYIKKVFGELRGVKWAEGTGELIVNVLGKEIKIEAKGAGNQIRGLKFRQYRPDLYIIDDLEEKEAVLNEERRAKLKRWFFSDVLNSEDLKGARVVMLGTLLHEDCLINNILDEEKWIKEVESIEGSNYVKDEMFFSVRIEACNDALQSTWEEYIPTEKIRAKYEVYKKRGLLDEFYREFRNLIVPTQGAAFTSDMFKHYKEDWKELNKLDNVVIVDPAKTTNPSSADSAIVGVAFDPVNNKIYIRDLDLGKMHPDELYKRCCDMADRLGTSIIGYEVTSLNEFITYPFRAYIATRKRHYNLIELSPRGGGNPQKKVDRIRGLIPLYRMGVIYHNEDKRVSGPIEAQLLVFPNGKLVDAIDATAYLIEMFDIGDRMFSFNYNTGDESGIEKNRRIEEDEFSGLKDDDYEEPLMPYFIV